MRKDLVLRPMDFTPSFLSCEKDLQTILRKLFIQSKPYSDCLKKLLVINEKNCLDDNGQEINQYYQNIIDNLSLADLREKGYIKLEPKIKMQQHQEVKSYLIITFDNFRTSSNPQFRDYYIYIDVLCHTDKWDIGNFRTRPLRICGYIDGILNKAKLSGIGQIEFIGCNELVLDETLSGYNLVYQTVHGVDDKTPYEHDWIDNPDISKNQKNEQ